MAAESSNLKKIGVIGSGGMVGSPFVRWFEEKGYKRGINLFCSDTNARLNHQDNINLADIIFVAVPTPSSNNGNCDTSIVESVVEKIEGGKIIVIKSTVPPGTTERLQRTYPQNKFLFNPEFLTEARPWEDFINPDRQIVGFTDASRDCAPIVLGLLPKAVFKSPCLPFDGENALSATDAEMAKYLNNAFGAMKVTFANMAYDVCESYKEIGLNVDYENVRAAISADERIGPAWMNVHHDSYRGFGKSCFPKDLKAFVASIKGLAGRFGGAKNRLDYVITFFMSVWYYNMNLLKSQGLTIEDVSKHGKDITLNKQPE